MKQAGDFLAESEALYDVVAPLDEQALRWVTQFKGWRIEDVLVHLHFWNGAAALSATDPKAFKILMARALPAIEKNGFRAFEDAEVDARGAALRTEWIEGARALAAQFAKIDPKERLAWAGPSMSSRSSITARQMETWAHGFEVFDVLGLERTQTDRLRNIVMLGVNTFGWSHQVHGLKVPDQMPLVHLTLPSGETFIQGQRSAGRITGPAVDFAAVVTQTRAFADTELLIEGPVAQTWMAHAQCFAGGPVKPPAPGTRFKEDQWTKQSSLAL